LTRQNLTAGGLPPVGLLRRNMKCTHPMVIDTLGITTRCGKCRPCRIEKARQWSVRIVHEAEYHEDNAFVTLTYNEEHLPTFQHLDQNHLTLYFKKLRRRVEPRIIKYYACGEYGERNGRPHYHMILFGIKICNECRICSKHYRRSSTAPKKTTDCHHLEKAWGKGYVQAGTVTLASARYVADYIQKDTRANPGKEPQFSTMSQGIGERWTTDHVTLQTAYTGLPRRGKFVTIPRYYKKKLLTIYSQQDQPIISWLISQTQWRRIQESKKARHDFWHKRKHHYQLGGAISTANTQTDRNIAAQEKTREKNVEK